MSATEERFVFLCPRCLEPSNEGGLCANCGAERLRLECGSKNNPCRKPPMDSQGRLLSHAPLWWLRHTVHDITERFE